MYGQDFCIFSDTSLTNHMLTEEALFIFTGYQESYSDACTEIHFEFFFHHESRAKFYFCFDDRGELIIFSVTL